MKSKPTTAKKAYRRGWLSVRLDKIQEDPIPFAVVRDKLAIHERTLRLWLANSHFQDAGVAIPQYGEHGEGKKPRWYFDKEKLRVWLVATGAIKPAKQTLEKAENPPQGKSRPMTADAARQNLGLPYNFTIRNHP